MTEQQFCRLWQDLLGSDCGRHVPTWVAWAKECVSEEHYADLCKRPDEQALSIWYEYLYAGMYFVKKQYGVEVARRVSALAEDSFCLYPWELKHTANKIRRGATTADLLRQLEEIGLDSSEKPPTMADVKKDQSRQGRGNR